VDDLRMYQRVRTGGSYLGNSEKTVTFGLGSLESLDTLIVQWPGGEIQQFPEIKANQQILLTEGSSDYRQEPLPGIQPSPQQELGTTENLSL